MKIFSKGPLIFSISIILIDIFFAWLRCQGISSGGLGVCVPVPISLAIISMFLSFLPSSFMDSGLGVAFYLLIDTLVLYLLARIVAWALSYEEKKPKDPKIIA